MVIADANGLPISAEIFSASSHEVTLVEATLDGCFIDTEPEKLIGDLAYDSDPLDDVLAKRGIDLISPHKSNRVRPITQDGRKLRRYHRRYKIERTNAWIQAFRRIVLRWEWKVQNFSAFVHLGCAIILGRYL